MYQNKNIPNEEEQLKKLSPTLFERKHKPFYDDVPEDYFSTFPSRIQDIVIAKKTPVIHWHQMLWFRVLAPATVAAFAIVIGVVYFNNDQMPSSNLSADEIHQMIAEDPSELFDEEFIINQLGDEEAAISTIGATETSEQDDQAIIEYLMDDNLDVSNIINEL